MSLTISKRNTPIVLLFFVLLLQQAILKYTSGFAYSIITNLDELITIVILLAILVRTIRSKIHLDSIDKKIVLFYSIFVFIGLISCFIHPIQGVFDNLTDLIVCSRFIVFYFGVRVFIDTKYNYRSLIISVSKGCKVLSVITFLICVHDLIFDPFFAKADVRYGIGSLQLFYPHPSYMAVGCFTCICIFGMADGIKKKQSNQVYIILNCILMIFTLRSKAIASAILTLILYYVIVIKNFQFKKILYIIGAVLVLLIGQDQLLFYYGKNVVGGTRAMLTKDSINLAMQYFPLGTGFGTFGSNIAAKHYSPLYVQLGYLSIEGGINNAFLSDTFWPIVIAQTGFIGLICFAVVVTYFVKRSLKLEQNNLHFYWVTLSIMAYEFISSTSEPAFFNPSVCLLFAIFALIINLETELFYQ